MSIRQWSSFLDRNRRLFWHQHATHLMYEIEEDGDSELKIFVNGRAKH
jgi:hypothetical protein